MKFPAQMQRIYDAIERAANAGEPCPSNGVLAEIAGLSGIGTPSILVKRLEEAGAIEVERGGRSRVVTIGATGRRTAGRIHKPHFTLALDKEGRAELAARKSEPSRNETKRETEKRRAAERLEAKMDINARIEADQARLRARRDHWLALEQRKYRLPQRGRPLEEMPA